MLPFIHLNEMKGNHFLIMAALMAGQALCAQEDRQDAMELQYLDEVVVSDSKFELKRENSGKTVIKISAEELERNQGRTVAEIINTKSGIEITGSRGRDGDVLGVFARGGRGRQVLVLIDGVRVSDPSTFSQEYDLRLLSPSTIESIEIIKGAASTLYGTNAATAVINIRTKKSPREGIAGNFRSSVGTYRTQEDQEYNLGSQDHAVSLGGGLDRFQYGMDFSNRHKSGVSAAITPQNEEDVLSQYSTNLRLGYRFSDAFEINIHGNRTKFSTEYDDNGMEAPNLGKNGQGRIGGSSSYSYGKGALRINAAYSEYSTFSRDGFGESTAEGRNWVVDLYNQYIFGQRWHTILGVNYIQDRAEFYNKARFTIVDPYVNLVYVSDFGLNLNLGGRLNHHSEYGNHFVHNFNPSYLFRTDKGYIKLMGSYATSYITPNLTQLFGAFGGNPDLKPEENRTLEGGLELNLNKNLIFSTLYFNRREKNTIGYDANFAGVNLTEEIRASGVEVELAWLPIVQLRVDANYTFTERKGDNAIRIPKHKVNLSLGYRLGKATDLGLTYAHTGKRLDTDFTSYTDLELNPYSLVNLHIGHNLIPNRLHMFLGVDNLLNESYTEILGMSTLGRNFRVGIKLDI